MLTKKQRVYVDTSIYDELHQVRRDPPAMSQLAKNDRSAEEEYSKSNHYFRSPTILSRNIRVPDYFGVSGVGTIPGWRVPRYFRSP